MANGAEQQRVRKGRWQCAVGVFVSWRDERQQWCQMLSWGGGAGRTQKLEEDIENAWLWRPLRAAAKTDSATHTWSHTHTQYQTNTALLLQLFVIFLYLQDNLDLRTLQLRATARHTDTHRHTHTHKHLNKLIHTQCMPVSLCKPQSVKSQR